MVNLVIHLANMGRRYPPQALVAGDATGGKVMGVRNPPDEITSMKANNGLNKMLVYDKLIRPARVVYRNVARNQGRLAVVLEYFRFPLVEDA